MAESIIRKQGKVRFERQLLSSFNVSVNGYTEVDKTFTIDGYDCYALNFAFYMSGTNTYRYNIKLLTANRVIFDVVNLTNSILEVNDARLQWICIPK